MFKGIFEILLLVTALSMDAFAACFAYGVSRIRIPLLSAAIVSGMSGVILFLSLLAGRYVRDLLPAGFTGQLSFIILFVLGIVKLFDHSGSREAEEANKDGDDKLSSLEALSLGTALSIDCIAGGIGAGVMTMHVPATVLAAFAVNLLMMCLGSRLGKGVAGRLRANLSWLSGVMLLLLAFMRLLGGYGNGA